MSDRPMSTAYALGAIVCVLRGVVVDFLGVAGLALVAYGVWDIYRPAGLIVGGVEMVMASYLLTRAG
jgi:hypothetical protein